MKIARLVIRVLLTLAFLGAGVGKLVNPAMRVMFEAWGYPSWLRILPAVLELTSVVLLWIPSTTLIGSLILVCVMLGAITVHLINNDAPHAVLPVVLLLLSSTHAFLTLRMRKGAEAASAA